MRVTRQARIRRGDSCLQIVLHEIARRNGARRCRVLTGLDGVRWYVVSERVVLMNDTETEPRPLAREAFCYLTTTGRRTGKPHEIEIWFALHAEDVTQLAMMAGGGMGSDWVRNLAKNPAASIRIRDRIYPATARIVPAGDPDEGWIRQALVAKYRRPDEPLTDWGRTALPILFTLHLEAARQR